MDLDVHCSSEKITDLKSKLILHILAPDKFTLALIPFLNKEMEGYQQVFLAISKPADESICALPNVFYLKNPHKKHFFSNTRLVLHYFRKASKIIIHGNPILYYFYLFQFAIQKTYWVIYGHSDLGTIESNKEKSIHYYIKKRMLKKMFAHITHIEGDAATANEIFSSKARLFYSPMYLTNVINTEEYKPEPSGSATKNILMGNSTDPSNCHFEMLDLLLPYKDQDILIYCPLSYGPYIEYRDSVIKKGIELFNDKFIPLIQFMSLAEYRSFLNRIDVAVFNHKSQTAMGVTTSLLAMGKTVFADAGTTSFHSLTARGFCIFDINELKQGQLLAFHNVMPNVNLINKYYSIEALKESYLHIYES